MLFRSQNNPAAARGCRAGKKRHRRPAARSGNIRNTGNARAPSASASRPGASARQVETPRACMRRKCRAKQTRSVFVQCSWGPPCPEKVHAAREQSKKAYLNGRRPGTACMALKIACGL